MELLHTWFRDWWDGDYIFIVALVWSTHQASSCSAWELLVVVIVLSSAHILVIGGTGSISSAAASLVEITPQRIGYLSLVFVFCFIFLFARLCVCFVLSIRRVAVFLSFCLFVFSSSSSSSSWITRKWVLENGFLEISSNLIFWVMGCCSSSTLNIPWEFVSKKMSKDSYLAAMLSGHNVVTGRSRRLESRHNCVCFLHKFSRTVAIISVAVTVFFHIQCTCCRFAQAKCFFLKEPNPLKDT